MIKKKSHTIECHVSVYCLFRVNPRRCLAPTTGANLRKFVLCADRKWLSPNDSPLVGKDHQPIIQLRLKLRNARSRTTLRLWGRVTLSIPSNRTILQDDSFFWKLLPARGLNHRSQVQDMALHTSVYYAWGPTQLV